MVDEMFEFMWGYHAKGIIILYFPTVYTSRL